VWGSHFCANCGRPVAATPPVITCAKCGTALAADAKFCAVCGQAVGAAPPELLEALPAAAQDPWEQ
jgi:predicted amidophosphoribosyltransferase